MNNTIKTIEFGILPIRINKLYTDGEILTHVELVNDEYAVIKRDYQTNQPFAVMYDGNTGEEITK